MKVEWLFLALMGFTALLVVYPLWSRSRSHSSDVQQRENVGIFRQELRDIDEQLQSGVITMADHAACKAELELRLLADVDGNTRPDNAEYRHSSLTRLVIAWTAMGVIGMSWFIYEQLGARDRVEITRQAESVFAGSVDNVDVKSVERLREALEVYLKRNPDDHQMLYLRARTYTRAGALEKAAEDYRILLAHYPEQDNFIAEYAENAYLLNNRVLTPEVKDLLEKSLVSNPHNVTALGMLGMSSFEAKRYEEALGYWQRLLPMLPGGSANAETIRLAIQRAEELIPPSAPPPTRVLSTMLVRDASGAVSSLRLEATVSLAEGIAAQPDTPVFVFIKPADAEGGIPLAAARLTLAQLPATILLDSAQSPMAGMANLSAVTAVEVVARLALGGQPIASKGDWQGLSTRIPVDAVLDSPVAVQIDIPVE